ncbi:ead/Ea22-like family protein [Salmonella enterica]|uniref:Ead/Ea22-like family protein n=1 Tax=Salmonella enterica TaxID=28901 RepID=A0A402XB30_SALER|nr:ead/Ea22-like family protein [Salmonella enterica]EBQ2950040.1 ead/Ea22-like family protein [Salmonella enterica]MIV62613.1 ead/Ea22-like family protein [Salmonella enterica]
MTIDKQALREEFRNMQDHYSDPADRERQEIYIAAEAALDELDVKEEQRANWFQMAQKLGEDLDAAERRVAELESIATDYGVKFQKAQDALKHQELLHKSQMEAAEKCIAELEARQIALPQRLSPEGYHIDEAYMVDDSEGEYLDRDAVIEAISAAGIKVKGE